MLTRTWREKHMANVYNMKKGVSPPTDLKDVTATAAEINILDGVTATAAELNLNDNQVAGATIVVGTEVPNDINVTVQLTNAAGTAMATASVVDFYLADDAAGLDRSTVAPDGGIAIGTDGSMTEYAANLAGALTSEADGDIDITFTESGAATWYLVIVLPNKSFVVSAAITF
jgi:hypothetical protein